MNIIFREAYWGGIIILAGILLIVRNIFKIDLPVMGIIFPIIVITIGVSLLTGTRNVWRDDKTIMFSDGDFDNPVGGEQYSVVFGKGSYDLRNLRPTDKDAVIDVSCAFGSVELLINPAIPMKIKLSSAFGGGHLPNGNVVSFGERTYTSPAYREGAPAVIVKANVAFGGVEIREIKDSTANPL
ncbi:MAG: LiaF domain-containing protein [bacterium]